MTSRTSLAYWAEALCGIARDRTLRAFDTVEGWRIESLASLVAEDTLDAAVTCVLLVESIDDLESAGVPPARLLKKLKRQELWSTWAEIRVAAILSRTTDDQMHVSLEEGKSVGAQADWRFHYDGDDLRMSVEVKAVGLSDTELAFCRRMSPAMSRLLPKHGVGHIHGSIDAPVPRMSKDQRRQANAEAARRLRTAQGFPTGLRALTIVGHESEDSYRRRIASKVASAVRQLPAHDECYVALYWSNGAPLHDATSAIDWSGIPEYVRGVLFVGQSVVFPDANVHCFATRIDREGGASAGMVVHSVDGEEMARWACLVLELFEKSSGVRPTLLRIGNRTLIRRDGHRRLDPFNLLLDKDPGTTSEHPFRMRGEGE